MDDTWKVKLSWISPTKITKGNHSKSMVALLHLHRNLFELLLVIEVDVLGTALVHSSEFDCRIFAQESNLDNMTIRTIRHC